MVVQGASVGLSCDRTLMVTDIGTRSQARNLTLKYNMLSWVWFILVLEHRTDTLADWQWEFSNDISWYDQYNFHLLLIVMKSVLKPVPWGTRHLLCLTVMVITGTALSCGVYSLQCTAVLKGHTRLKGFKFSPQITVKVENISVLF